MPTVTKPANANTPVSTGWTNPTNAQASTGDNVYATATPAKNGSISSDYHFAAFSTSDIPDGSIVDEVRIVCEGLMSASVTGGLLGCQGYQDQTVDSGAEATKTTITEGTWTKIFNSTPTLSTLRTGLVKARVRCAKGNTNNAMTGSLDFVRIEVDYTASTAHQTNPADSLALSDSPSTEVGRTTSPADSLALADAPALDPSLTSTDSLALTDAAARTIEIIVADALGLSDSAAAARGINVVFEEGAVGLTDSASTSVGTQHDVTPGDSIALADSSTFDPALALADTLALSDTPSTAPALAPADTVSLQDAHGTSPEISPADTAPVSDASSVSPALFPADALSLSDAVERAVHASLSDSIPLSDSLSSLVERLIADSLVLLDSSFTFPAIGVADAAALSDSVAPQLNSGGTSWTVDVADILALTDAILRDATLLSTDALSLSDSASIELVIERLFDDSVQVTDAATPSLGSYIVVADLLDLIDATTGVDLTEVISVAMSNILLPFPCPYDGGKMYLLGDDRKYLTPASATNSAIPVRPGVYRSRCVTCGFELVQTIHERR